MSKTPPIERTADIASTVFYTAKDSLLWLGRKVVQLIDLATVKFAPSHLTTPVALVAAGVTVFGVFKLSSFFYDVAKLDWSAGKVFKASAELALSFFIFTLAISIAAAVVLSKMSRTDPSTA